MRRAAVIVALSYAGALAAALTLPSDLARIAAGVAPGVVVLYCWARPDNRWDILLVALAPGAVSVLLSEALGAPSWIAWLFVPPVLGILHQGDRRDAELQQQASVNGVLKPDYGG